ncbi:DNA topoisomerase III [Listeria booriae]|uniref:DNA topoisomerase 3 n=1 Tax=Listeria booriae TaxID=1552123 RepID=A0A7X0YKM4_9LIST|nr:DNA topoisomerase III [Listeria booriae]MBC1920265.1 DNA topoisomerase III [Listeria booriae]MBC1983283.1 DNA topoisomerase III [Listeria booriae]MBC2023970.1 DNA topoisomerase III [Listeria booriae]MBC2036693.1 DNA topoisomerase III [Listeria booriae]MBC2080317.1 DNA topoisomerase III [Listeria booriae]
MTKIVVLAEKPSVGKDIARVLGCKQGKNGYLEGSKYIVTWALGHLITLADPENYDTKYKSWNMEDLPMLPQKMKLVPIKQTRKQYETVKSLMTRKDVSEIIIATDAGREGELVARWIIEYAKVKKPIKRLWISSVTDKAIREGFNRLQPGKAYENLYRSAEARSEADWVVGINATRALTTKYNAQLSCGRVQTPTLAMIAQREEEIRQFKPKEFYQLTAVTEQGSFSWSKGQTFDEAEAEKTARSLRGKDAIITDVAVKEKKTHAPGLYDLTELQRDANKRYDFSAKETLNIMQTLYERHKVLTYPRTDSRFISDDIVPTLKERVEACGVGPYAKPARAVSSKPIKANKSFVDNSKVSDHHAIIPTEETPSLSDLNDRERKIYDLVVKRFLAVLSAPFTYEETAVQAKIGDETFGLKGKVVKSLGWKAVYNEDNDTDTVTKLKKGEQIKVRDIQIHTGKTKPPARFNEATLLSAMENPSLTSGKKDLAKTLGETGGLGTVATRADIIEKLFNSFSIEKQGKDIMITSKGRQLLDLVPTDLKSPELTAIWEQKLSKIANGKLDKTTFTTEMRDYAKKAVNEIKQNDKKFKHDNITSTKCPDCGKLMLRVKGKKGTMLVCQDRECGHREAVARTTNARCPNCHKRMELRGEGDKQIFTCSCGYREKLSSFNARRGNEKNKNVSKKEVANYMKKQNKQEDEPFNNPMAEALAKLKLK